MILSAVIIIIKIIHLFRYVPSQSDVVVFNAVGSSPSPKYVNALRWYNQIASYNNDEKLA